jgi:hypothetical protein
MAQPNSATHIDPSALLRYGLAVVSFAVAFGAALLAQHYQFRNVELPLFLFGVAVTAWYARPRPTIVLEKITPRLPRSCSTTRSSSAA